MRRALLFLLFAACSEPAGGDGARDAGGMNPGDDGGGMQLDSGSDARPLTSIAIDPVDVELVSRDGARPEQIFTVKGIFSDGSEGPVAGAAFSIDPILIGVIGEATGRFVANGTVGGTAVVTVRVPNGADELTAEATVRVKLERIVLGGGVTPDAADLFNGTPIVDPARAADVVYPLDRAVMPENVFPAEVQWLNGEPGDLFMVEVKKPSARTVGIVGHTGGNFTNSWLVDLLGWRSVAQTEPDQPATITVLRRTPNGDVIGSPSVSIRFVRASLAGSIYYWDIAAGRILRIDDGTNNAVSFMPNPPDAVPDQPGGPPSKCVGCHSVSPSGRWMAGRLGGGNNVGGIFDLTLDLTQQPVPTTFPVVVDPPSVRWWFSSWSPDEARVVVTTDEATAQAALRFLDPFTGMFVDPVQGTMPVGGVTHPAWSPDGTAIAYVANADSWGGQNSAGDIAILPVIGRDAVGTPAVIHSGASLAGAIPNGAADSYPTWSPDSQWIAFAHGNSSRSENGFDALYLMKRDGSQVTRLDNASGGPNTDNTYQPRFSPFHAGGYFWMSYLSKRDYGNALAGTRGTGRQQIWVSAISDSPQPGVDPSEVGYWLPGQSRASMNISAFWAARPCRQDGEACEVASSCCSGDCRPNDDGALVCSPAMTGECRQVGQPCGGDADCCAGAVCIGSVCNSL